MTVIKCPNCDSDVSDKATYCINCGCLLNNKKKLFCKECNNEISIEDKICSKCGCPINNNILNLKDNDVYNNNLKKHESNKNIIKIIIIISAVFGLFIWIYIYKTIRYKGYFSVTTGRMLVGAQNAEYCGNMIKSVWSNTIWHDDDSKTDKYTKTNGVFNDDFNDSLKLLFEDPEFIDIVNQVKQNQDEVNDFMKELKNPPLGWEDAHSYLKDHYDDYISITNLCINPSGSLDTYSRKFNDVDESCVNNYNKLKLYFDE